MSEEAESPCAPTDAIGVIETGDPGTEADAGIDVWTDAGVAFGTDVGIGVGADATTDSGAATGVGVDAGELTGSVGGTPDVSAGLGVGAEL